MIVDDYSDPELVSEGVELTNAVIIQSKLAPGRGEILPYYYFQKFKPFHKAVLLNDGMFVLKPEPLLSAVNECRNVRFLWHFEKDHNEEYNKTTFLISKALRLNVRVRLEKLRSNVTQWVGCFAGASIMTWDFLNAIDSEYGFLHTVAYLDTRERRMGFERLVSLIALDSLGAGVNLSSMSVYGDIYSHRRAFKYNMSDYDRDREAGILSNCSAVKIWNGR